MDTLGPRIMVNVGTQAVSNTGVNPRDLAPLTNDAFLATFLGKTSLSTNNGLTRQANNHRQSYTTQFDRVSLRSKTRASTSNGESGEPDSAILSIIRGNTSDSQQQTHLPSSSLSSQRQLQGHRHRRRSWNQPLLNDWNDVPCSPNYRPNNDFNRRRRTRSGGAQQQISVVDQMAAQPHIPYAILPKRFEPKQVASNGFQARSSNNKNNNNNWNGDARRSRRPNPPRRLPARQPFYDDDQWLEEDNDDLWLEPVPSAYRRRLNPRFNAVRAPQNAYYGQRQRFDDYYDSYAYGPSSRKISFRPRGRLLYAEDAYLPFNIVPTYDLNEWQGPYARSRQTQAYGGPRSKRGDNGFIRDDHRANKQSRNGYKPLTPTRFGKKSKSPKDKEQQKRRNSRGRKARNQNSKTEATTPSLTTTTDKAKSATETTNETKTELTVNESEHQPLPPREQEHAQTGEQN